MQTLQIRYLDIRSVVKVGCGMATEVLLPPWSIYSLGTVGILFSAEASARLLQPLSSKPERGFSGRRFRYTINSIEVLSVSAIVIVVSLLIWAFR